MSITRMKGECRAGAISKIISGTFMILIVCFLVEEYLTFGMWNANSYLQITECSEKYYNFKPHSVFSTVRNDKTLYAECGVSKIHNQTSRFDTLSETPPAIITKCSKVTPKLISHRKLRQTKPEVGNVVPNVVHYVNVGSPEYSLLNYLSFRSVHEHVKPKFIFIHGDALPWGSWWDRIVMEIPNIYYVYRERPERIQGRKSRWTEHSTDIMRLQTIYDNGGIYLDTDVIVLKSLDPLRQYDLTLGRETYYGLGSGVIIAKARSPFVCVWFNVFREYNPFPWNWAYYAVHTPHKLAEVLPNLVHIEDNTIHRPSFEEADQLFDKRVDWSDKYSMHIWKHYGHVPDDIRDIARLNTTLGEVMRFIYYGSPVIRDLKPD